MPKLSRRAGRTAATPRGRGHGYPGDAGPRRGRIRGRVEQIGGGQWQAATPDDGWAVRDLVNHVVSEDLWAPPLLAGSTVAEVGDRFDGDVLGTDPKAAWAAAAMRAVRAAGADGAMDRIVHLSFGDFPGRDYTLQLFADHLIHAWDLARAIGADEGWTRSWSGPVRPG